MTQPPEALDEKTIQAMLWQFATRSSDHALLLLDEHGNVTWANSGATDILGTGSATGLVGVNFSSFFTPEDASKGIPEHELAVAAQSGTASDDRWMARLDQSRFWAAGVSVYLGNDTPRCRYLKIFRDLTEQKMQLETTRERGRAAVAASENMSAAIALLAHELRNPLTGIGLGLDLLELRLSSNTEVSRPLAAIADNVQLATRLVDDLMQHSKVSSSSFQLDPTACTLRQLLRDATDIALQQMGQPDRDVTVLVPVGDIQMRTDRMRMQQVFVNLVTNAIRYTPAPGRIWVTGTIEGPEVIVRIADEGVGIEPAQLDQLFDAFTGGQVIGTKLGLGLGLALVKKIVELHGGSVQARSEGKGKGSQFVVRIPAVIERPPE